MQSVGAAQVTAQPTHLCVTPVLAADARRPGCWPGTGKSSLVSTVDSLVKGQLTRRAVCGSEAEGPMTKVLKRYEFSRGSCNLPLVLWDTAGWAEGPAHNTGATLQRQSHTRNDGWTCCRRRKP
jgi:hypothetical protein